MSERVMRISIAIAAVINLATGLYAGIAPGSFQEEVATYGAENGHLIGDIATAYLAIGLGLAIAIWRPSWRVPTLAIAAVWTGLHALNHLGDISEASNDGKGITDTILLGVGALLLAYLAWIAWRAPSPREETR